MPRTLEQIETDLAQWLERYRVRHAPAMTARDRHTCVRRHAPLSQATAVFTQALQDARASAVPDIAGVEATAKALCLAWIATLKTWHPDDTPVGAEVVEDTTRTTPLGRWHSRVLGVPILVCPDRQTATAQWGRADQVVPYTLEEVDLLQGLRHRNPEAFPDWLQWLHQVKTTMQGILEPGPPQKPRKNGA